MLQGRVDRTRKREASRLQDPKRCRFETSIDSLACDLCDARQQGANVTNATGIARDNANKITKEDLK